MATAADRGAPRVRATVDGVRQQFTEQIEFFRSKLNLPSERFDQIRGAAHNAAFMVSGMASADMLVDMREALDRSIQGESIGAFRKDFRTAVRRYGWTGWTGEGSQEGEAWRTRVIYQTNVATSRAAGRRAQLLAPALLAVRPFWRYRHSDRVEHPRPFHKQWGDMRLTLRYDHPFWQTHYPPNGMGCMCDVVPVAEPGEADATQPPEGWDVRDPVNGRLPGIDANWDHAPGANGQESLRQLVQDKLIDYPPAIAQALSVDLNRQLTAGPVAEFARQASVNPTFTAEQWLGFVENAPAVSEAAGVNVQGYFVTLQADAARAIQGGQPDAKGAQRPVAPDDFLRVLTVLNAPSTLRAGELTPQGNATLVAERKVGRELFRAVFEVLSDQRTRLLSLRSLVIRPGSTRSKPGA